VAFANGTTQVYIPIAGSAGASLWGTDVRKVLLSPDATSDATTITNQGTGGAVTRTLDPFTTTTADLTEADYGYAIDPADMNSVAGATRRMLAGTHTIQQMVSCNRAATGAVNTYTAYLYKVGASPTFTRTLQGSFTTAAFGFSVTPNTPQAVQITMTSMPQIDFAAGETVAWSLEFTGPGTAAVGRLITHYTGTTVGATTDIRFPALKTVLETDGAITATVTPSGVAAAQATTVGAIAASAALAGIGAAGTTSVGAITASVALAGIAAAGTTTVGAMTASAALSGAGAAGTTTVGAMTADVSVNGIAAAQALSEGAITASATLAGIAATGLATVGAMTAQVTLDGIAGSGVQAEGSITASVAVNGAGAAGSGAEGAISVTVGLDGTTAIGLTTVGHIELGEGGTTTRPVYLFED
jgi:hypothetical protein